MAYRKGNPAKDPDHKRKGPFVGASNYARQQSGRWKEPPPKPLWRVIEEFRLRAKHGFEHPAWMTAVWWR